MIKLDDSQIMARSRIRFQETGIEVSAASMPVEGNRQPFGLLHGGATGMLVESVASYAANLYAQQSGKVAVGTELSVSHLKAVTDGSVRAVATARHLGATSAIYTVDVTDEDGELVATGRMSCRIIEPR